MRHSQSFVNIISTTHTDSADERLAESLKKLFAPARKERSTTFFVSRTRR